VSTPDAGSEPVVRPYALTRGRTKPEHAYPLEALVVTSVSGEHYDPSRTPEAHAICRMCTHSRSVAEIAANLHVPIGVTRVIIGDMADAGLVLVHGQSDDAPNTDLLERVLGGLRKL
jgi:Protein of unknown function (DUF742)